MNCGLAVSLAVITHLLFRWSLDKAIQRIILFCIVMRKRCPLIVLFVDRRKCLPFYYRCVTLVATAF